MKYRLLTIAACLIVTASMLLIPIDAGPAPAPVGAIHESPAPVLAVSLKPCHSEQSEESKNPVCGNLSPTVYPRAAVIVDIDPTADTVTAEDCTGNRWSWYGIEDWAAGDCCSLLMDTNGTTDTIYDDIVILACYESWTFAH